MQKNAENRSGIAITVALLAALSGGLFLFNSPLESLRPDQSANFSRGSPSSDFVNTRLWQDPLIVIQEHWNSLLTFVEERQSLPAATSLPYTISKLPESFEFTSSDDSKLLRLFVLVNGSPYAEDIERRRRHRYALVSALTEEEYVPDNESGIGYFVAPNFRDNEFNTQTTLPDSCNLIGPNRCPVHESPILLGYETFSFSSEDIDNSTAAGLGNRVQVLWLNGQDFTVSPIDQFASLISVLDNYVSPESKDNVSNVVIGPAGSGSLVAWHAGGEKPDQNLSHVFINNSIHYPESIEDHLFAQEVLVPTETKNDRFLDTAAAAEPLENIKKT